MDTVIKTLFPLIFGLVLLPPSVSAGEWGVGAAIAHFQPPQNGVQSEFISTPYVTYHGERLNIDMSAVSYTLLKSSAMHISMEGDLRFEGYDPKDSLALTGMEKRSPAFDAGIGLARSGQWGEMKFVFLHDITGTHNGAEAIAQYQIPYVLKRFLIAPAIGISRQNSTLVDYYYGVRANETTNNRPRYSGSATTNIFVNIAVGQRISNHLEFSGGLKFVRLGKRIEDSPIVIDRYVPSLFSALQYKF